MKFNFDATPDRRGTDSQKWQRYAGRDVLPLWVADMDFASPPAVIEALRRRVEHGVFGYARPTKSTIEAVTRALEIRYGWAIDPGWLVWLPGLVCGLNVTANAFASPGDEILCLAPVYPPFTSAPKRQGRVAVPVPLRLQTEAVPAGPAGTGRWLIDWGGARTRCDAANEGVFLLPSAQSDCPGLANGGTRAHYRILRQARSCPLLGRDPLRPHIGPGHPPCPTAKISSTRIITLMAPSKTYNMPGLGTSFAVISDAALRAQFVRATAGIVAEVNALGYAACEAAYKDSEPWRQELLAYLRENRELCSEIWHPKFRRCALRLPSKRLISRGSTSRPCASPPRPPTSNPMASD